MSDLVSRMALAGAKSGPFGTARNGAGGITLRALPEGHVILAMASPGAGDLTSRLSELSDGTPHAVRAAGPGQWVIVGPEARSNDPMSALERKLEGQAVLVDQSHGRSRILIEGAPVEAVLAKGCAVDFDLGAFPVGHSVVAMVAHVSTHVTRVSRNGFELLVTRSFAEHIWDELIEMAREYGGSASVG